MMRANALPVFFAAALLAVSAAAQEQSKIDAFLTDPIEVYDAEENYLDDYDVGSIDVKAVTILDQNADMIKLDFAGVHQPAWVFRTDVKSMAGCRVSASARHEGAKDAGTMGLDGDLCE